MNVRTLLFGLLWSAVAGLSPVAATVLDDIYSNQFTDWIKVKRLSIFYAAGGAAAFWRKHRALLQVPPGLEDLLREPEKK